MFYRATVVRHHWASLSGALQILLIDWLIDWLIEIKIKRLNNKHIARQHSRCVKQYEHMYGIQRENWVHRVQLVRSFKVVESDMDRSGFDDFLLMIYN